MAIQTTIARHYAWRNIIMAVVCLVLGLWGVWDYTVAIPAQERHFQRGQVCRLVKDALEPGNWREAAEPARVAVQQAMSEIVSDNMPLPDSEELQALRRQDEQARQALAERFEAAIDSIRERNDDKWLRTLVLFDAALKAGEPFEFPLTGVHLLAHDVAERGIQEVAGVSQPSRFDRPTQWMFILCLPFVPWSLWVYFKTKAAVYRLDDDGTLHMPDGSWKREEIADIDMSRWMTKSIATVVHVDGRTAKLDDYKHRNLHLIIGAIASRLYPEKWDENAKPVKASTSSEQGETTGEAGDEEPVSQSDQRT